MSQILVSGVPLDVAAGATTTGSRQETDQFWASTRRPIASSATEVLEVNLGAVRSINLLSFEVSRFPLTMTAQWWDGIEWMPFRYPLSTTAVTGFPTGPIIETFQRVPQEQDTLDPTAPVNLVISDSVPATVDRADDASQHTAGNHWVSESWKVTPVRTSKIRLLLQRNPNGVGPIDPRGFAVDFSLALRRIQFGYRIDGEDDFDASVPEGEIFASSHDILGSEVLYSIYRQTPERAVDGSNDTAWRSDPQPVNYAVVPFYVDVRDTEGNPQVIDRWYVDPLTLGVHCNIYWSDEDPTGDFLGARGTIPLAFQHDYGTPASVTDSIALGPDTVAGTIVDNRFTHMWLSNPWWVGYEANALTGMDDAQDHTLLAIGTTTLLQRNGSLVLTTADGNTLSMPLPDLHVTGTTHRVIVAYQPAGLIDQNPHVLLRYSAPGSLYQDSADGIFEMGDINNITGYPADLSIGLPSSGVTIDDDTPAANIAIKGLVAKTELLTDDASDLFLSEGAGYVVDDLTFVTSSRNTNINAIVRMHPIWVTPENPFGVVGGDGGRIEGNLWHPIPRDYTLRRGWMEHPPIKARYFKFEFTELSPQIFETFLTINRLVRCFPLSVVQDYLGSGPTNTNDALPPGTATMVDGTFDGHTYIDALRNLVLSGLNVSADTTSVLVANQPQQADQVADAGWVWQYQPWHAGTLTPRWNRTSRHYYDVIPVRHRSKIAYFVGLKTLRPAITNYSAPVDTAEYVEEFYSDGMMADVSGWEEDEEGFRAVSAAAVLTSVVMSSVNPVQRLQFATVQTNPVQVLEDPDLTDLTLDSYEPYGDSTPEWLGDGLVRLKRFYVPITNLDVEHMTYAEMERYTYAELEGASLGSAQVFIAPPLPPIGEIGPASSVSGSPTVMRPHQFSETEDIPVGQTVSDPSTYTPDGNPATGGSDAVAGSIRYFSLVFPATGTITVDTYLSTLANGTWPVVTSDVWANIYLSGGASGPYKPHYRMLGRSRLSFDGVPGTPVTFAVYIASSLPDSTTATLRVRTSDLNDTTLWDPYDRPIPPYSEGGLVTRRPYIPMGAGEVTAKVKVTTNAPLNEPLLVEIIGADHIDVLASTSQQVPTVGTTEIAVSYTPPGFTDDDRRTYGDVEDLFDTDPPVGDFGSPFETGPGSTDPTIPKGVWPHSTSTNTYVAAVTNLLYYTMIPTTSGQVSIDTYLTTVTGTDHHDWATTVTVTSGLGSPATFTSGVNHRVVGDALAGEEINFFIQLTDTPLDTVVSPVVRISDVGNITLWVPDTYIPPTDTTYGFLEGFTYGELESSGYADRESLYVRIRQQGITDDEFFVHQIALYDDPIAWSFSSDGGQTFYRAPKIRNDPHAVMTLPDPGNQLCWRVEVAREDVWLSSLHVRPWYDPNHAPRPVMHDAASSGPNDSTFDHYPRTHQHPLWILPSDPVHLVPVKLVTGPQLQFWRNLVVNPGGEGPYVDLIAPEGGTVEPQIEEAP